MEKNVGKIDKIIRGVLAAGFIYLGLAYNRLFFLLALLLIATIVTGFCWPYRLLKIDTTKYDRK